MANTDALYTQFIADLESSKNSSYGETGIQLVNSLFNLLKGGFIFNNDNCDRLSRAMNYICYTRINTYNYRRLTSGAIVNLKYIMEYILNNENNINIPDITLSYIIASPETYAIDHIIKQKTVSSKILSAIANISTISGYYTSKFHKCIDILTRLKSNKIEYEINEEHIDVFVKYFNTCGDIVTSYYSDNKIVPSDKVILAAIKSTNLNTIKDLLIFGGVLNKSHLEEACARGDISIINFIMDSNVKASNKCIVSFIDIISQGYSYRPRPVKKAKKGKKFQV